MGSTLGQQVQQGWRTMEARDTSRLEPQVCFLFLTFLKDFFFTDKKCHQHSLHDRTGSRCHASRAPSTFFPFFFKFFFTIADCVRRHSGSHRMRKVRSENTWLFKNLIFAFRLSWTRALRPFATFNYHYFYFSLSPFSSCLSNHFSPFYYF
jgi:hypothetical protein